MNYPSYKVTRWVSNITTAFSELSYTNDKGLFRTQVKNPQNPNNNSNASLNRPTCIPTKVAAVTRLNKLSQLRTYMLL